MNELIEGINVMMRVMSQPLPAVMLTLFVGGAVVSGIYEMWTKRAATRLALNPTKK